MLFKIVDVAKNGAMDCFVQVSILHFRQPDLHCARPVAVAAHASVTIQCVCVCVCARVRVCVCVCERCACDAAESPVWIARKPIMTALGFEAAGLAGIVLFIGSCEAPVACKAQGRMTPRPTEYVLLVGAQYAPRRSCTFDSVDVPQQRSSAHATLMIYIYIYICIIHDLLACAD